MAPCILGVLFGPHLHPPLKLMTCLKPGSLIMLSIISCKGRRVVRQIVLSQTEQGKGILRERLL